MLTHPFRDTIKPEVKTYTKGNVKYVECLCPDGYTVIDEFTPTHTITPWDVYGYRHVNEISAVLSAREILHVVLTCDRTNLVPWGTGPQGRVRFGDAMMPGTYSVAVPCDRVADAQAAMAAHKVLVDAWLNNQGPMPSACR